MVKSGKMTRRGLGIQAQPGTIPYGVNTVSKKFFIGQLLAAKLTFAGSADAINLRAATWGFSRIDYCEVWPQFWGTAKRAVGAGFAGGVATVMCWYNTAICTVYAGASLGAPGGATGVPIYGIIFGS